MNSNKRLFIVYLYGVYGSQWYCAVYANDEEEAVKKGKDKYDINKKESWRNFEECNNIPTNNNIKIEFIFNEDGVSNLWYLGW